jgi:hypothetical protein
MSRAGTDEPAANVYATVVVARKGLRDARASRAEGELLLRQARRFEMCAPRRRSLDTPSLLPRPPQRARVWPRPDR